MSKLSEICALPAHSLTVAVEACDVCLCLFDVAGHVYTAHCVPCVL